MFKCVELKNGSYSLVDAEDFDRVSELKWRLHSGGYASSYKSGVHYYMHRFIMNPPKDMMVDHINKNKLDNRKSNLRIVTRSQNMYNSSGQRRRKSKYKGVHYAKANEKWSAHINWDKKKKNLGYFDTEEEAAHAYNEAAIILHGEYAQLNIVEGLTSIE